MNCVFEPTFCVAALSALSPTHFGGSSKQVGRGYRSPVRVDYKTATATAGITSKNSTHIVIIGVEVS
jgi:hypothetical protein